MYELQQAKYVEKLPKGKHSVKGVGRTEPDPECVKELPGGVQVPLGKGVELNKSKATSLLYNEYPFIICFYETVLILGLFTFLLFSLTSFSDISCTMSPR